MENKKNGKTTPTSTSRVYNQVPLSLVPNLLKYIETTGANTTARKGLTVCRCGQCAPVAHPEIPTEHLPPGIAGVGDRSVEPLAAKHDI